MVVLDKMLYCHLSGFWKLRQSWGYAFIENLFDLDKGLAYGYLI